MKQIRPTRGLLAACLAIVFLIGAARAADVSSELIADGDWSNAANWSPSTFYPNNGNGGFTFEAVLPSREVTLNENITLDRLEFAYRPHFGGSNLKMNGFDLQSGEIAVPLVGMATGSGMLTAQSALNMDGGFGLSGPTLQNLGTGFLAAGQGMLIQESGVLENAGYFKVDGYIISYDSPGTINNSGVMEFSGGFGDRSAPDYLVDFTINNTGTMRALFGPGTGGYASGQVTGATLNNEAGASLEAVGTRFIFNQGSKLNNNGGTLRVNGGEMSFGIGSTLNFAGGQILLENNALMHFAALPGAELTLPAGSLLRGDAYMTAHVTSDAVIDPEGELEITYGVTLLDGSVLQMELGGLAQGAEYDFLRVGYGGLLLDGLLDLSFLNGFASSVAPTDQFTILQVEDFISGTFDNALSGDRIFTSDGLGSFRIDYGTASPFDPRHVVLSDFQRTASVPEGGLDALPWAILLVGLGRMAHRLHNRDALSAG